MKETLGFQLWSVWQRGVTLTLSFPSNTLWIYFGHRQLWFNRPKISFCLSPETPTVLQSLSCLTHKVGECHPLWEWMDAGLIVVDIGGVWLREWVGIWVGVYGWVSWDVGGGVENGGWVGSGKIHRTPGMPSDWTDIGWQSMANFSQFNDESSTNYTVQHIAGITVVYLHLSPDQKITRAKLQSVNVLLESTVKEDKTQVELRKKVSTQSLFSNVWL